MKITDAQKLDIKKLITEKESLSACEIVPMIVQSSSSYTAAHFKLAILVSFLFCLCLYYSPLTLINPIYYLWIQIPGLILGYILCYFSPLKRIFISPIEMEQKVSQHAYESFMHHNLHLTKNHNGILIFISEFEHKIKIIADHGITSKIGNDIWDNEIHNFIRITKNESLMMALFATIRSTGDILAKHFPSQETTANELENDLIIE